MCSLLRASCVFFCIFKRLVLLWSFLPVVVVVVVALPLLLLTAVALSNHLSWLIALLASTQTSLSQLLLLRFVLVVYIVYCVVVCCGKRRQLESAALFHDQLYIPIVVSFWHLHRVLNTALAFKRHCQHSNKNMWIINRHNFKKVKSSNKMKNNFMSQLKMC